MADAEVEGVPPLLAAGVPMLKVSSKKIKPVTVRLTDMAITWPSLKGGRVDITSIRELRLGQSPTDTYDSKRWLTIVYVRGSVWKVMHLIAHTDDVYELWVSALQGLVSQSSDKVVSGAAHGPATDPDLLFIRQLWPAGQKTLNEAAAKGLCGKLGLDLTPEALKRYQFPIDSATFRQLVRDLQTRPDLDDVYARLARDGPLNKARVIRFLTQIQHVPESEAAAIFERYAEYPLEQLDEQEPKELPVAPAHRVVKVPAVPPAQAEIKVEVEEDKAPTDRGEKEQQKESGNDSAHHDQETGERKKPIVGLSVEGVPVDESEGSQIPQTPNTALIHDAVQAEHVLRTSNVGWNDSASASPTSTVAGWWTAPSSPYPVSPSGTLSPSGTAVPPFPVSPASPVSTIPSLPKRDHGVWGADAVKLFLSSPDNVYFPAAAQDLSKPLTDYFISSSHNTYLVAEQWRGASTVEGYVRVLLGGCRCVEIDCHDGSGEPIVYHAKTITSSVGVRDVCQAIKKYAFVASPYPLILSLEVRCGLEQQDKLAQILVEELGDLLVTEPLEGVDGIPSPEQLKGRILVKAKGPPSGGSNSSSMLYPIQSSGSTSSGGMGAASLSPPVLSSSPPTMDRTDTDSTTESDSSILRLARKLSINTPKAPGQFSKKLVDLAVYTQGTKYRGFSKLVHYASNQMFSVSERTSNKILASGQASDWVKHNTSHLSRVYPKGSRLSSSNYNPIPYWEAGAQMVSLNYQTLDQGTILNHALFAPGGYVLKPPCLRHPKIYEREEKISVKLTVISAQRLPPTPDLYVEATLHGPDDYEESTKTRRIHEPTLNPRWDSTLTFAIVTKPSLLALSFLHLEIKQSGSGVVAQWIRPLADCGRGWRYLPLEDATRSKFLFASLFVRLDIENDQQVPLLRLPSPPEPKSPRK